MTTLNVRKAFGDDGGVAGTGEHTREKATFTETPQGGPISGPFPRW